MDHSGTPNEVRGCTDHCLLSWGVLYGLLDNVEIGESPGYHRMHAGIKAPYATSKLMPAPTVVDSARSRTPPVGRSGWPTEEA